MHREKVKPSGFKICVLVSLAVALVLLVTCVVLIWKNNKKSNVTPPPAPPVDIDQVVDEVQNRLYGNILHENAEAAAGNGNLISSASGCPRGYAPTANDMNVDVAIVGAGPGGMFAAYSLWKNASSSLKVVIIDNRAEVGGKVQSFRAPSVLETSATGELNTPTCAEQLRWADVDLRCVAQELGVVGWARQAGSNLQVRYNGFNATPATIVEFLNSAGGTQYIPYLYPNGNPQFSKSHIQMPDFCANPYCSEQEAGDWKVCDPEWEMFCRLTANVNNAVDGPALARFSDYMLATLNYSAEAVRVSNELVYLAELPINVRAQNALEFLDADWNVGTGPRLTVIKGGPQKIYIAMKQRIQTNPNYSFKMGETVVCLDEATDSQSSTYPFVLRTDKRNVRAKRVLFATPGGQFNQLVAGSMGTSLGKSEAIRATANSTAASTVNLFFASKWWLPSRSVVNRGTWQYSSSPTGGLTIAGLKVQADGDLVCDRDNREYACNKTLFEQYRKYTHWTMMGDTLPTFVQYLPTPERQQANLLRVFFDDDQAENIREIFDRSGTAGVQEFVMNLLRIQLPDIKNIPNPLKTVWKYEQFGYAHVDPYTSLSNSEIRDFAKTPIANRKISFASESFNFMQWGWQQAAVDIAKQAFQPGGALAGLLSNAVMANWGKCTSKQPAGTYSGGRVLDFGADDSWNDPCLLLSNEIDFRDLASNDLFSKACAKTYGPGINVTSSATGVRGSFTSSRVGSASTTYPAATASQSEQKGEEYVRGHGKVY